MAALDFVTIIVPVLNEGPYIERAIRSLVPSGVAHEILVVDGGSSDGTREVVWSLIKEFPSLRIIDNPARIQAAAVNIAARVADPRSSVMVRADAHCRYAPGFVLSVANALIEKGANSVVVPMRTVGEETCFQAAVSCVQNSPLGNGGSSHRSKTSSGWVEHGHHAAFDRKTFLSLGGYDESFPTNEDAEYDVRVVRSGGRIWMLASATVDYYPRKTASSLARQYFRHGRGRAGSVAKHRLAPRLRQMAPVGAFVGCVSGFALSQIHPFFLSLPAGYAVACLGAGCLVGWRHGKCGALSGAAAMIMHLSWGAGFMTGMVSGALSRLGTASKS